MRRGKPDKERTGKSEPFRSKGNNCKHFVLHIFYNRKFRRKWKQVQVGVEHIACVCAVEKALQVAFYVYVYVSLNAL